MSAPTYFGSASNPADNGTGADGNVYAVTPPASMVAGDLCILVGAVQVASPSSPIAIFQTGGQTWSAGATVNGTDITATVFWCQWNGTWAQDPSLVFASESGTQPVSTVLHVFRPSAAGTWMVDTALAGGAMTSASPQTITDITPHRRDNVTLACWAQTNAATWGTLAGTGWVAMSPAQFRNTSGSDQSITFAHRLQATPAATANVSQTPSTATTGLKWTMAWYNRLAPTVALNTPADTGTTTSLTPTLNFTGTDGNADTLEYQVQVDTVATFDSSAAGGSSAIDRTSSETFGFTYLDRNTPINKTGTITVIKIFAATDITGLVVGTFYGSGTSYQVRNQVSLGNAPAGLNTFSVNLAATSGDLLGCYFTAGSIDLSLASGNKYRYTGDAFAGGAFTFTSQNNTISLEAVAAPLVTAFSATGAAGFTGGHPFASGSAVEYTLQQALSDGVTYYWRAAAIDPEGQGAWPTRYSFVASAGATSAAIAVVDSPDTAAVGANFVNIAAVESPDTAAMRADYARIAVTETTDTAAMAVTVTTGAALAAVETTDSATVGAAYAAIIAAIETADTAAQAVTVTTGAAIAATETTDSATVGAAYVAVIAATESADTAAQEVTVTTGVDAAAVETADTAEVNATSWTTASVAAVETSDTAEQLVVVVNADVAAIESSDAAAMEAGEVAALPGAISAIETSDSAEVLVDVTTGVDVAAIETSDTAAVNATNWTIAEIIGAESPDAAAIETTVTAGADIAAVEFSDIAAVISTSSTNADIAGVETADVSAMAVEVTTGADVAAIETADSAEVLGSLGAQIAAIETADSAELAVEITTSADISVVDYPDIAEAGLPRLAQVSVIEFDDVVVGAVAIWTTADAAATETQDTVSFLVNVTTGIEVAATESADSSDAVAAIWTTVQVGAVESPDNAAQEVAVTTAAAIEVVESADIAIAGASTGCAIAAVETADSADLAVTVTTAADLAAIETADNAAALVTLIEILNAEVAAVEQPDSAAIATIVSTAVEIAAVETADRATGSALTGNETQPPVAIPGGGAARGRRRRQRFAVAFEEPPLLPRVARIAAVDWPDSCAVVATTDYVYTTVTLDVGPAKSAYLAELLAYSKFTRRLEAQRDDDELLNEL